MKNYISEWYSLYKRNETAIHFTFPGGEGGPQTRWMRGRDGGSLLAPNTATSAFQHQVLELTSYYGLEPVFYEKI